jgi:glyoxylase-like metal-dependent hydrolase (beta-lactamase superfamily II)
MTRDGRPRRVLAPNPSLRTLEGTNTWIVGRDPAIVIDPGPDDAEHLREVEREAGSIGAIVLTHGHPDHAPGAVPLAAVSGARILAFRPPPGGDRLRDGQAIVMGEVALVPLHTPGHTPDHVAFQLGDAGMFTGDAVLGRGTTVIDPPEGDLAAYLRSLRRLLDLRPRTLFPGHGPLVLDGAARIAAYIGHRRDREREILAALAAGPGTAGELAETIYADLAPEARALGARSILAHLESLAAEGRLEREDDAARGSSGVYALGSPRSCERCGRRVEGRARLCARCRLSTLQEPPDT